MYLLGKFWYNKSPYLHRFNQCVLSVNWVTERWQWVDSVVLCWSLKPIVSPIHPAPILGLSEPKGNLHQGKNSEQKPRNLGNGGLGADALPHGTWLCGWICCFKQGTRGKRLQVGWSQPGAALLSVVTTDRRQRGRGERQTARTAFHCVLLYVPPRDSAHSQIKIYLINEFSKDKEWSSGTLNLSPCLVSTHSELL